jgi:hypothetical protein
LFLLMVLWVNLHGSFLFGIVLLLLFRARGPDRIAARRVAMGHSVGLSLQATLVNPAGFAGLVFPFNVAAIAPALVPEWQPSTFGAIGPFEVSLLAGLFVCLFLGIRVPPLDCSCWLGWSI